MKKIFTIYRYRILEFIFKSDRTAFNLSFLYGKKDEGNLSQRPNFAMEISGGYLEEAVNGVTYYGHDGQLVFFPDIRLSTKSVKGTAFQFLGVIHINKYWASSGFNVYDFTHEYGHFIQEKRIGSFKFLFTIGILSVCSVVYDTLTKSNLHGSRWFEREASQLGFDFINGDING